MLVRMSCSNMKVFLHAEGENGNKIELLNKLRGLLDELSYFDEVYLNIDHNDEDFKYEIDELEEAPESSLEENFVIPISDET